MLQALQFHAVEKSLEKQKVEKSLFNCLGNLAPIGILDSLILTFTKHMFICFLKVKFLSFLMSQFFTLGFEARLESGSK